MAADVNDRYVRVDLAGNTRHFPAIRVFAKPNVGNHSIDWGVCSPENLYRFPAPRDRCHMKSRIGERDLEIHEQKRFIVSEQYCNRFHNYFRTAESH